MNESYVRLERELEEAKAEIARLTESAEARVKEAITVAVADTDAEVKHWHDRALAAEASVEAERAKSAAVVRQIRYAQNNHTALDDRRQASLDAFEKHLDALENKP